MSYAANDNGHFDATHSFELALTRLARHGAASRRDAGAVRTALGRAPLGWIAPDEIDQVARAWMNAARALRERYLPCTLATAAALVATGGGAAEAHARWLIGFLLDAECANDSAGAPPPPRLVRARA